MALAVEKAKETAVTVHLARNGWNVAPPGAGTAATTSLRRGARGSHEPAPLLRITDNAQHNTRQRTMS
uniref:Uncharacterized protein n=1 Tax=Oryza punctata TaxID=4537 RepID=A0A0E0K4R0_ORYPU